MPDNPDFTPLLEAAARRAAEPGCDEPRLFYLYGPQGCGKTCALEILAGPGGYWSINDPSDLRGLPESVRLVGITDLTARRRFDWREFVSRRVDRYKRVYQREVEEFPRRFICVAEVLTSSCALPAPISVSPSRYADARYHNLSRSMFVQSIATIRRSSWGAVNAR